MLPVKRFVQLVFADADFNGQLPVHRRADHFGVCNVPKFPSTCYLGSLSD